MTLQTRCPINRCRYNRVWLSVCVWASACALTRKQTLLSSVTTLFNLMYPLNCHTTIHAVLKWDWIIRYVVNRELKLLKLKEYHLKCHSPSRYSVVKASCMERRSGLQTSAYTGDVNVVTSSLCICLLQLRVKNTILNRKSLLTLKYMLNFMHITR